MESAPSRPASSSRKAPTHHVRQDVMFLLQSLSIRKPYDLCLLSNPAPTRHSGHHCFRSVCPTCVPWPLCEPEQLRKRLSTYVGHSVIVQSQTVGHSCLRGGLQHPFSGHMPALPDVSVVNELIHLWDWSFSNSTLGHAHSTASRINSIFKIQHCVLPMCMIQFYEIAYGFLVITLEASRPNKPARSYVTSNMVTPFSLCLSTSLISILSVSSFSLHPPSPPSLPSLLFLPPSLSIPLKGLFPHQQSHVYQPAAYLEFILLTLVEWDSLGETVAKAISLQKRVLCFSPMPVTAFTTVMVLSLSVATASELSKLKAHSPFRSRNCLDTCLSSEVNTVPSA